jgi:hypothetical protein
MRTSSCDAAWSGWSAYLAAQVTFATPDGLRFAVPSRAWALLEALAYAGALIDPSGVLAGQRLRRIPEQEQGHGRR